MVYYVNLLSTIHIKYIGKVYSLIRSINKIMRKTAEPNKTNKIFFDRRIPKKNKYFTMLMN